MKVHISFLEQLYGVLEHGDVSHRQWLRSAMFAWNESKETPRYVPPKVESTPMLLWCPMCSARHVDEGEFATKPHHTHACQSCGCCWRPAIVPTTGVRFLPGFKDPPKDMKQVVMVDGAPVRVVWK